MKDIFSSGGGTQSAYTSVLIIQGRLPKPDVAVIVDTERENSEVWAYHEKFVVPGLASVGVKIHRVKKSDYTSIDLFSGRFGTTLMIPAFTNQTGEVGKLTNFCSHKWKRRVRERFVRELGIPTKEQRTWICFSTDEARRVNRMMLTQEYSRGYIRFPLVHDVPSTREESIQGVIDFGWDRPPRSACWMCPNKTDAEWVQSKEETPEDFKKAIFLEWEMQLEDPNAFLHKSCVPINEVKFSPTEAQTERGCGSGGCFV